MWLREVRERRDSLDVDWRYFSLEQVNSREEGWQIWEQSEESAPSLAAFKGAEAARRQGTEAFDRFHHLLLEARHERKRDLNRETVLWVAERADLDLERFQRDLDAPDITDRLMTDYLEARERGVFGTPTIFFGDSGGYLRMMPASRGEDAVRMFDSLRQLIGGDLNVQEIKRPEKRD